MNEKKMLAVTDKLVEFAQTTVIQEQMIDSMNSIISNMRIPGAGNPLYREDKTANKQEGEQNES